MRGGPFNRELLRACLKQDRYRFHPGAWQQLRELQISLNDTLFVLLNGRIDEDPQFETISGQWRFIANGNTVDQKELTITFTFNEIEGIFILTISEGPNNR